MSERKIDQKKKTQFKYKTLKIGGTNAMLTAVAGTHSFPTRKEFKVERKKNENYVTSEETPTMLVIEHFHRTYSWPT